MTREEAIEVLEKLCGVYPLLKPVFNMAISALREQEERKSPCDLCRYNPPSCFDGKPCTMCPASAKEEV